MSAYEQNIALLTEVAKALGGHLSDVTFLGGCTTALLVDAAAHFGVRQTQDVDVIANITTYVEYQTFAGHLRALGFVEDIDGHTCRWLWRANGQRILLDVMPINEQALGFANIWYPAAIQHSQPYVLQPGLIINLIAPVYFLATKFEAFAGRGHGDYYSHDLEDIVFVLENRAGIAADIAAAEPDVRRYLAQQCHGLLNDQFLNILPGLLNHPGSAAVTEALLRELAGSAEF